MEILAPFIKTAHIGVALLLVIVILIQPGKSDELGTVFGGGSSESVFGAGGATPFLAKATRFMAVVFVLTSLSLGYLSLRQSSSSVLDREFAGAPAENVFEEELAETTEDKTAEPVEAAGMPAEEGIKKEPAETTPQ